MAIGPVQLGIESEQGIEKGAAAGAQAAAAGAHAFSDPYERDVIEDILTGSAAALVLLEHQWAVPLRDAVQRAGGMRVSGEFVSPLDLIEIGVLSRSGRGIVPTRCTGRHQRRSSS